MNSSAKHTMSSTSLNQKHSKNKNKKGRAAAEGATVSKTSTAPKKQRKHRRAATSPAPEAPTPQGTEPWSDWLRHLKERQSPVQSKSSKAALAPLFWGLGGSPQQVEARQRLETLVTLLRKPKQNAAALHEAVGQWRLSLHEGTINEALAMECLAWARSLPRLARVLEESVWRRLLDSLHEASHDAGALDVTQHPLTQQALHAELPLTLAVLLPELDAFRGGRKAAWKAVGRGIKNLLDGNGLPQAAHWHQLRSLTACWIRCVWLEQHELDCSTSSLGRNDLRKLSERGLSALGRNARLQLEWAVRETIRGAMGWRRRVCGCVAGGVEGAELIVVRRARRDAGSRGRAGRQDSAKDAAGSCVEESRVAGHFGIQRMGRARRFSWRLAPKRSSGRDSL